jgi:transcriptional regulator with XRE-family HTH domain
MAVLLWGGAALTMITTREPVGALNSSKRVVKGMASSPDKLLLQIADRTATFLQNTGVTQARLCRYLSISDSSLSQFLNGTKRLDPATTIKLCQVLSLSHREVAAKFTEPVRTSKILSLQESMEGRPAQMRLDGDTNSGWYPGTGNSGAGQDPNDGRTIDDVPDADTSNWDQALIDKLRETRGYHRKAIRTINDYIQKAKVNAGITTPTGVTQKFGRR